MSDLYQKVLLAHAKKPHGAGRVPRGPEDGEALNTACGDEIRVALTWTPDGTLQKLTHELHGCAVSAAGASMVAQRLEGKTREEIAAISSAFTARIGRAGFEEAWGDFQAFNGIEKFPARIHCAQLVWLAVEQALTKGSGKNT